MWNCVWQKNPQFNIIVHSDNRNKKSIHCVRNYTSWIHHFVCYAVKNTLRILIVRPLQTILSKVMKSNIGNKLLGSTDKIPNSWLYGYVIIHIEKLLINPAFKLLPTMPISGIMASFFTKTDIFYCPQTVLKTEFKTVKNRARIVKKRETLNPCFYWS